MNDELERIRTEYVKRDAARVSDVYSYTNPAFFYHMQERERGVMRMLRRAGVDLPETDVLEIGCGTGHILQRFLDFGARSVMGVELMPHRIRMGREKTPAVPMLCGDAGALPLPSESFGLVTQFMCLSSVLDEDLRMRIAGEMWRVLTPGGIILSYDLRPNSVFGTAINYCVQYLHGSAAGGHTETQVVTPIRTIGAEEIRRLFPKGRMDVFSMSLNFQLASLAALSSTVASCLAVVPTLRTHLIAAIRKPV
jgi:ubiquinone/menaquinone biosynthesis C-methylase UbiE